MIRAIYRAVVHLAAVLASFVFPLGLTLVSTPVRGQTSVQSGGQTAPQRPAQRPPAHKELMAEDVYKNIQVLRGIPENQFLATMGFFSASIGESCESCHRGTDLPKVTPNLAEQYSAPIVEDPDVITEQAPGESSADQILDKYVQALGGAQRLAAITSFIAKGTYQGYAEINKSPIEIIAKAPGQRATTIHTSNGDWTTTFDGLSGWVAEPGRPVPLLELTDQFLEAVKVDADLAFPGRIKQALSQWRVGYPTTINDREVEVVQGSSGEGFPVKLYFDKQSGLLVRQVRYTNSPVGLNPTQIDYADCRDVSGVKMPFRWTTTWTDGRSATELSQIQANAPIDAAKFAKPAAPASRKPISR